MDVHCTTCGEPWDVYHLRHDAIFETDLDHAEAKAWSGLPVCEPTMLVKGRQMSIHSNVWHRRHHFGK